eukprot:6536483-Pyramimonas_sp.AAC.1
MRSREHERGNCSCQFGKWADPSTPLCGAFYAVNSTRCNRCGEVHPVEPYVGNFTAAQDNAAQTNAKQCKAMPGNARQPTWCNIRRRRGDDIAANIRVQYTAATRQPP